METNKIYLGNCYELIKQIPDKSIDLVYVDIPYLIGGGGIAKEPNGLATRISGMQSQLGNKVARESLEKKAKELKELMDNATTKDEYEKYHCLRGNILNKINLESADIVNGIDYKILDEYCRVLKYIYIYIYGVARNKYLT